MTPLDDWQLLDLAGGPVRSAGDAAGVEPVTQADVDAAQKLAHEAEELAAEAERRAVLGAAGHEEAVSAREGAKLAVLRAGLVQRKAERHAAAERLRGLQRVGEAAVRHAGQLAALRDATLSDLAEINELHARIRNRISAWNEQLGEIASRGAALSPGPLLPTGVPPEHDAGVWAGTIDAGLKVIVRRKIVSFIDLEDRCGEGWAAVIDAAVKETTGASSSDRLILLPGGTVTSLGADKGGHLAAQISAGTVHELTPRERERYLRGERITWESIDHD